MQIRVLDCTKVECPFTSARSGVGETKSRVAQTAVRLCGTDTTSVLTDVLEIAANVNRLRLTQMIIWFCNTTARHGFNIVRPTAASSLSIFNSRIHHDHHYHHKIFSSCCHATKNSIQLSQYVYNSVVVRCVLQFNFYCVCTVHIF